MRLFHFDIRSHIREFILLWHHQFNNTFHNRNTIRISLIKRNGWVDDVSSWSKRIKLYDVGSWVRESIDVSLSSIRINWCELEKQMMWARIVCLLYMLLYTAYVAYFIHSYILHHSYNASSDHVDYIVTNASLVTSISYVRTRHNTTVLSRTVRHVRRLRLLVHCTTDRYVHHSSTLI